MATQAHCIYAFEALHAALDDASTPSLSHVEELWSAYLAEHNTNSHSASNSSSGSTPANSTPSSKGTSSTSLSSSALPPSPLFVTWNTLGSDGKSLRGCIGTFEPQPLERGLREYALTSAFHDTRFRPIAARELPSLAAEVILLTDFEAVGDPMDWTLGTHGIRISFSDRGRRYGATYLPDVAREQGWSKDETMRSLMRKAGWSGSGAKGGESDWERLGVQTTRYQGRKVGVAHGEWAAWRAWGVARGEL